MLHLVFAPTCFLRFPSFHSFIVSPSFTLSLSLLLCSVFGLHIHWLPFSSCVEWVFYVSVWVFIRHSCFCFVHAARCCFFTNAILPLVTQYSCAVFSSTICILSVCDTAPSIPAFLYAAQIIENNSKTLWWTAHHKNSISLWHTWDCMKIRILYWAYSTIKCGYLLRMLFHYQKTMRLLARSPHQVFRNVKLTATYIELKKLMDNWNENTEYRSNEFSYFVSYKVA